MRLLCVCIALTFAGSCAYGEPVNERVEKLLRSDNYTVTWGKSRNFESSAELEIGSGGGHGGTLRWMRFHPSASGVDVLLVELDEGRERYRSRWAPDQVSVSVKQVRIKSETYAHLLRDLAIVESATLKPVEPIQYSSSSNSFWVYAQLTVNQKTILDLNWAGYWGRPREIEFAKPQAAVNLAQEAIKSVYLKDHKLTDADRAWASAKFARDWKKFRELDFHWWVRERYIAMIGVVGDRSALSALRDILAVDPPNGKERDSSEARCTYLAINAVTRLIKTDVRSRPVEEMDIEPTRKKVLQLLDEKR